MGEVKESRLPDAAYLAAAVGVIWSANSALPLWAILTLKALPLGILTIATVRPLFAGEASGYRRGIALGFFFSLIGDVVIVVSFLGGIGAFFLAHIAFLSAMGLPKKWARQVVALAPGAVLFAGMFFLFADKVPSDLFLPVLAYMSIICMMWSRAMGRFLEFPTVPYAWLLLLGATLFTFSDAMIAINKWVLPIPDERVIILGSYFMAQFFIRLSVPTHQTSNRAPMLIAAPPL